jgi:hypothetical protein
MFMLTVANMRKKAFFLEAVKISQASEHLTYKIAILE